MHGAVINLGFVAVMGATPACYSDEEERVNYGVFACCKGGKWTRKIGLNANIKDTWGVINEYSKFMEGYKTNKYFWWAKPSFLVNCSL